MKKSKVKPTTSRTAASRKGAPGKASKGKPGTTSKGPWVARHPVLALGTMAAGVGAYALLRSKGDKKSTRTKRSAGLRTARGGK